MITNMIFATLTLERYDYKTYMSSDDDDDYSAFATLGLKRVLKFFCVTNHALCVFHSAPGYSSSISNLLRKLGTNL